MSCSESKTVVESTENSVEPHEQEQSFSTQQIKELKTASKVVYNLPSPAEMAKILHETEAIYDVEILNNPKASGQYYTDVTRALNLGVYFADLSFTSMFDYPQQAMLYMSAAEQLSEELNIVGVFNKELMERLENNLTDKDSIMEIVSMTYMKTDFYLQENDRSVLAKAILAGAWVEGLFVATKLNTPADKQNLVWEKIGEQKNALNNLINMLDDCKEPQLAELLAQLRLLNESFNSVGVKEVPNHSDSSKSTAVVYQKIIVPADSEAAIEAAVKICRNNIVSGK